MDSINGEKKTAQDGSGTFYHCFQKMCRTMAAGTDILMWISTTTLTLHAQFFYSQIMIFFACSSFSLFLACNCVCPAKPPGRPATQADGAFPVIKSIYLSS